MFSTTVVNVANMTLCTITHQIDLNPQLNIK